MNVHRYGRHSAHHLVRRWAATATATATASLLLVVGISVGRKVGLLLLSFPCRDWTARRRRPPFQVFSDGAALDMLQVNARRGDGRSDAFDLTSAVFLPTSPVPFDSFFLTAHTHTPFSCRRRLSHPVIECQCLPAFSPLLYHLSLLDQRHNQAHGAH